MSYYGSRWTDEDLRRVVPQAKNFSDTARRLGFRGKQIGGNTHNKIKTRVLKLGLDVRHFQRRGRSMKTNDDGNPLTVEEIFKTDC